MLIHRGVKAAIFGAGLGCVILFLATQYLSAASSSEGFLIITTTPSFQLGNRLLDGCQSVAAKLQVSCEFFPSTSVAQRVNQIEDFVAKKGSGLIFQTYGASDYPQYEMALQEAQKAGVPTVVVSSSLIEAASAYQRLAVSIVGISSDAFVSKAIQAISGSGANGANFCILAYDSDLPAVSQVKESLVNELTKLGAKPAACPSALQFRGSQEETLTSAVRDLLTVEDVNIIILPFINISSELGQLRKIALQNTRKTVFLSIWPSPFDSGQVATQILYQVRQGSSVAQKVNIAPFIQISTDQYCDKCDCDKETNCKDACPKCNK
jgi:hypothetical protein